MVPDHPRHPVLENLVARWCMPMVRYPVGDVIAGWLRQAVLPALPREAVPIVGLSAPQGAGKTTVMRGVCEALARDGLRAVSVSIDDFYLTSQQQIALARQHPENPYLQHRGYPGTHDVALGASTLRILRMLTTEKSIKVPCYDRFAHRGDGDRMPESHWRVIAGPLHVVVLEGWMLGFTPVDDGLLEDEHLGVINERLAAYRTWHLLLRGFIWIEPEDHAFVRDWRVEAEERARAEGKTAMSPQRTREFVEAFLPAYVTYYPRLRRFAPTDPPHLRIVIGRDRAVKSVSFQWLR
jgi:D-glycerate 3-kinase